MRLSDRIRPDVEAAPWVVEAVKKLEAEVERCHSDLRMADAGMRAALRTVAERQREACARAAEEDVSLGRTHEAVRATPLVTEGDK